MHCSSCNQRDQRPAPIRAQLGRWDVENSILPHHINHSFTYTLARATYGPQGSTFYKCICSLQALKRTLICAIVQIWERHLCSVCVDYLKVACKCPGVQILFNTHMHYHTIADFTLLFNSISDIISSRFIWLVSSLQHNENIYWHISITLTFRLFEPEY